MILALFRLEVNEANAAIIGCEKTGEACLVDAGDDDLRFDPFLAARRLRLTRILVTHEHWDHTDGLGPIQQRHPDAEVFSFNGKLGGERARRLRHDDPFTLGALEGRIVHTPGHTPDGISWILPGVVFTGDALFNGAVGGTATPEDYQQQINAIRQHLLHLPDHYQLLSGHGPATTIGIEKRFNPFFN